MRLFICFSPRWRSLRGMLYGRQSLVFAMGGQAFPVPNFIS
jgi:hypothetical protein